MHSNSSNLTKSGMIMMADFNLSHILPVQGIALFLGFIEKSDVSMNFLMSTVGYVWLIDMTTLEVG